MTRGLTALVLAFAALAAVGSVGAHAPAPALYGSGTAVVDGAFGAGEWEGARRLAFDARLPAADGGGTVPASLRVMNDGVNLYLALEVGRPTLGGSTSFAAYFDNDHSGTRERGDEAFYVESGASLPARFVDRHWFACGPSAAVVCHREDIAAGGTGDGSAAAGLTGSSAILEAAHPLDSADDPHDFSLRAGGTVGFGLVLQLMSVSPSTCGSFATCVGETILPVGATDSAAAAGYGNIVVAPDTVAPVTEILGGPAQGSRTRSATASFTFGGEDNLTADAQLRFSCSLDGAAFVPCPSRVGPLSSGRHRLAVRAIDELGNADATPVVRSWRVDRTAPARPSVKVSVQGRRATVRLSSRDPDDPRSALRYLCALDRAAYAPCRASFSRIVAPGRHLLRVRAADPLGNTSGVTARAFVVRA